MKPSPSSRALTKTQPRGTSTLQPSVRLPQPAPSWTLRQIHQQAPASAGTSAVTPLRKASHQKYIDATTALSKSSSRIGT